jgi:hypothetical protein
MAEPVGESRMFSERDMLPSSEIAEGTGTHCGVAGKESQN